MSNPIVPVRQSSILDEHEVFTVLLHLRQQPLTKHVEVRYLSHCVFRGMRWAGHVARMGEGRGVHRVLVGKPEGKRPLGRLRRRWKDNIKIDLQEVGGGCEDWMELAQDRDRWGHLWVR